MPIYFAAEALNNAQLVKCFNTSKFEMKYLLILSQPGAILSAVL
jgi:hypothetical protein